MRATAGAESGQATDLVRVYAGRPGGIARHSWLPWDRSRSLDISLMRYSLRDTGLQSRPTTVGSAVGGLESRLDLPKPLELPTPYDPNRPVAWSQDGSLPKADSVLA